VDEKTYCPVEEEVKLKVIALTRVAGWPVAFRTSSVTAEPFPTAVTGTAGTKRTTELGGSGVNVGVGVIVYVKVGVKVFVNDEVDVGVKVPVKVVVEVKVVVQVDVGVNVEVEVGVTVAV
jgi:hypothetical protein